MCLTLCRVVVGCCVVGCCVVGCCVVGSYVVGCYVVGCFDGQDGWFYESGAVFVDNHTDLSYVPHNLYSILEQTQT